MPLAKHLSSVVGRVVSACTFCLAHNFFSVFVKKLAGLVEGNEILHALSYDWEVTAFASFPQPVLHILKTKNTHTTATLALCVN